MKNYQLTKDLVFKQIVKKFPDNPKITSLAENARSLFYYCNKKGIGSTCFPMLGSMGQETSMGIGLSIALAKSKERVVVISSDGSLFANINSLITVGVLKPNNLSIIVLDNEVHGITGGQPTASKYLSIAKIATSCGLKANEVKSMAELERDLIEIKTSKETHVVIVKVNTKKAKYEQITDLPAELFRNFSKFISTKYDQS